MGIDTQKNSNDHFLCSFDTSLLRYLGIRC